MAEFGSSKVYGDLNVSRLIIAEQMKIAGNLIFHDGRKPSWTDIQSKPTTFTPSSHTHAPGDINTNSTNRFVTDAEKSTWNNKSNLSLGTGSGNAYRGDRGLVAYNHSQSAHAPSDANNYTHPSTHPSSMITGLSDAATTTVSTIRSGTTKANVGLGSVDNYSRSHYDGRYLRHTTRNAITVNSSTSEPLLNLNATSNDGVGATLLEGSIASNTTSRFFMTFKGSSDAVNWQVSTDGVLRAGTVPTSRITGLSDAATTTVATIRSGTTKANVGLGNVGNYSRAHYDGRYAPIAHVTDTATPHKYLDEGQEAGYQGVKYRLVVINGEPFLEVVEV